MRASDKYAPTAAFAQVRDSDAEVRRAGAKWIHRQSLAGANRWTDEWLRDPKTVDVVLPLLSDPDANVAEEAIGAAWGIAFRYQRDRRLLEPAVALLTSESEKTRASALDVVAWLDPGGSAGHLLRAVKDPKKLVRARAFDAARGAATGWPFEDRERMRAAALEGLMDPVTEVRYQAANLLALIGNAADLTALKACLKAIKGLNYRSGLREAIEMLQARLQA